MRIYKFRRRVKSQVKCKKVRWEFQLELSLKSHFKLDPAWLRLSLLLATLWISGVLPGVAAGFCFSGHDCQGGAELGACRAAGPHGGRLPSKVGGRRLCCSLRRGPRLPPGPPLPPGTDPGEHFLRKRSTIGCVLEASWPEHKQVFGQSTLMSRQGREDGEMCFVLPAFLPPGAWPFVTGPGSCLSSGGSGRDAWGWRSACR